MIFFQHLGSVIEELTYYFYMKRDIHKKNIYKKLYMRREKF